MSHRRKDPLGDIARQGAELSKRNAAQYVPELARWSHAHPARKVEVRCNGKVLYTVGTTPGVRGAIKQIEVLVDGKPVVGLELEQGVYGHLPNGERWEVLGRLP